MSENAQRAAGMLRVFGAIAFLTFATDASAETVQISYDALGRVISLTAANGMVTTYTYDAAGNRTQSLAPPVPPPPPPTIVPVINLVLPKTL